MILLFRMRHQKLNLSFFAFGLAKTTRYVCLYESNKDNNGKIDAG